MKDHGTVTVYSGDLLNVHYQLSGNLSMNLSRRLWTHTVNYRPSHFDNDLIHLQNKGDTEAGWGTD
jgi:hypothetical protein